MKKIFTVVFFALIGTSLKSQDFVPQKTPDVIEFMRSNYLPVNEYNGRADITIPLYEINLDGLSIPISLTYNTGGVQVNTAATRVGLNWSLNAGGMITKETLGDQDTYMSGYSNFDRNEYIFNKFGYLRHLWPLPHSTAPVVIPEQYRDTQPDLFYVAAPGLNTKFIHRNDGKAMELSNTGCIIKSPFESSDVEELPNIPFEVISNKGLVYSFLPREFHAIFPAGRGRDHLTDELVSAAFTDETLESEVLDMINSPNIFKNWGSKKIIELFPSTQLTSIHNPVTNKSVLFHYDHNFILDNDRHIERQFSFLDVSNPELVSQVNYEHDYTREKVLSKIEFPEGVVDFYYSEERKDIVGAKRLEKLEVRSYTGKLIIGALFDYDYFEVDGCTDPQCFRLILTGVKFYDSGGNALPGYKFEYDKTPLPKRFSINQDYAGYYNGDHGVPAKDYIPNVYFKNDQGKRSYLPFQSQGYSLIAGNVSLEPDLIFAKAGILNKITYPTGGYSELEYELNTFKFSGETKSGFGLRVAAESLYESSNTLARKITYDYSLLDGTTSGSILGLPQYVYNELSDSRYQSWITVSQANLKKTNIGYVGYSRVKLIEEGNGYTVKEFSSSENFPDIYPSEYEEYNDPDAVVVQNLINTGKAPGIYQNMDLKRGKLISSQIYNQNDEIIQSQETRYRHKIYEEYGIHKNILTNHYVSPFQNGSNLPYIRYDVDLYSESYLPEQVITEERVSLTKIHRESTSFQYSSERPFISQKSVKSSEGNSLIRKYFYPFDTEVADLPYMSDLAGMNIVTPVKEQVWKDNVLLETELAQYGDFGRGKLLPTSFSLATAENPLEKTDEFGMYDKRGNLIEYKNRRGIPVTTLWGYNYSSKIAEVVNAGYSEVLSVLGVSNLDYLQYLSDSELSGEIDKLRNNLLEASVYSYLHEPLVGMKLKMDPNKLTELYEYDNFNRLTSIKDNEANVLKHYDYNYRSRPGVVVPSEQLNVEIKRGASEEYDIEPIASVAAVPLTAVVRGGVGNYRFEWTEVGSAEVLGRASFLYVNVACGENKSYQVKVIDGNNVIALASTTTHGRICAEPFFVSQITLTGTGWSKKYEILPAEGGSENFKYDIIFTSHVTSAVGTNRLSDTSGTIFNTTSTNASYTLTIRVTDKETNQQVSRTISGTLEPDFNPSCFIEGTLILMADGTEKKIEDVKIGESVLTYNLENDSVEAEKVESIVSPKHSRMVEVLFSNNTQTTSTFDHPYFIKDKGWSSYQPDLTKSNYGLEVNRMEKGDIALVYNPILKQLEEVVINSIHELAGSFSTYNLDRVGKNHNFFANGILVHNKFIK